MKTNRTRMIIAALVVTLLLPAFCSATLAQSPLVPEYQKLYAQLNQDLDTFITTADNLPRDSHQLKFSSELMSANGNCGTALLGQYHMNDVNMELDRCQQLGLQGVVVEVSFPMLYQPYYASPQSPGADDYQQFLNFYKAVQAAIKAHGLKMYVESQSLLKDAPGMNVAAYYATLNSTNFAAAIAQHNAVLATQIKPDYISLVAEPDTQAAATGQTYWYDYPTNLAQLLQQSIAAMQAAGASGVEIGAGCGDWQPHATEYTTAFCQIPGINAIDCHFYQPGTNGAYYQVAFDIANVARQYGKPMVITECWYHKNDEASGVLVIPTNPAGGVSGNIAEQARDTYEFWTQLDCKYLSAIANFASRENVEFQSSFPHELYAYLHFNDVVNLPDNQVVAESKAAQQAARQADQFTRTGLYYSKLAGLSNINPGGPNDPLPNPGGPNHSVPNPGGPNHQVPNPGGPNQSGPLGSSPGAGMEFAQ